jgi:hypothetical protein
LSNDYDNSIEKRAKVSVFIPRFGRRSYQLSGLNNDEYDEFLNYFNKITENDFYLNKSNQQRFRKKNGNYFSSKRASQLRIAFPRMG